MIKFAVLICVFLISFHGFSLDHLASSKLNHDQRVDYLWHFFMEDELDPIFLYSQLDEIDSQQLSLSNQLRVLKMRQGFERNKSIIKLSIVDQLKTEEALKLASEWDQIKDLVGTMTQDNVLKIQKAKRYLQELSQFTPKSQTEISDLFFQAPDYAHYNNGEYMNTLKLYLFCRHDRRYPCLFVMRDIFDNVVRNEDGSLWTLPGLAHSRRGLPYNMINGYTPSGIHTIDSVMPEANRQQAFGKWRRAILNFIPKTKDDEYTKGFLPLSAHNKKWWLEASVARDIGRNYLRIHGTGNINQDPDSPFYTFYATSGCIATRENTYDGVTYQDQRIILDRMMSSMQLAPIFANEIAIKGVLYVVELDDKKEKVSVDTLREFGIE